MKLLARRNQAGNSIVLVISILAVLGVLIGTAIDHTSTVYRHVQRGDTLQAAVAIADGVLEHQFSYWREICRINTNVARSTNWMKVIPLPDAAEFPSVAGFTATTTEYNVETLRNAKNIPATVSNVNVKAVDPQLLPIADDAAPPPAIGMNNGNGDDTKAHAIFNYVASADVTLPTVRGNVVARVRRVFQKEQISPWNWAIFYVDPLEIHPGPNFYITGWVHTNSDLFTAHGTLNFLEKATYARDWEVNYRPGDSRRGDLGNYPLSTPKWPSNLPPALNIAHQPFGLDATRIFNPTDNNPNNDSYHELIEMPDLSKPDPLAGQRYHDQAGIRIFIDGSNNVKFYRPDPNDPAKDIEINSSSSGNDKKLSEAAKDGLSETGKVIQDYREQSQVRLATFDIEKFYKKLGIEYKLNNGQTTMTGSMNATFNGIIYIQDTSAAANGVGNKRGIRLLNGRCIAPGGLTVASPNPIYIQGDYNSGFNPPSNSGTFSDPDGNGYTRQPCSVIADAVNILSNAWNDSSSTSSMTSRNASATTVNTAIVSGIIPTGNGNYSGGAENFPRFLEDWSGVNLTYYGSMVQLYNSRQAIGPWGRSNVYSPPVRQWYFENLFKLSTPPGSLMLYSYVKGRWTLL